MQHDITLAQFRYSHFNEKARWALDLKGIPHTRLTLLPGPHMAKMKKLTGQTKTPALRIGDKWVTGSAQIIDTLEDRFPVPALYPAEPNERQRALELERWFDANLGPQIRLAMFSMILDDGGYICNMFAEGRPLWQRAMYRATYPFGKILIKKGNGVTSQQAIDDAFAATRSALDRIQAEIGPSGYLVGEQFSVADLTAAALSAAAANPAGSPMERPAPMPQAMQDWLALWDDHPAVGWVRQIYARHRGASAEVANAQVKAA